MSDKNYKSLQEAYNSIYEQQYTVFGGNRYLVKPDGTLTYPTDGRTTPTPDELKAASTAPKLKPVQTTTTDTTTQTSPKPTTTSSQTVAAAGGKGGTVTVGKQYPATLGGKSVNVSYDASGKRTVTPVTSQPSTTTASPSSTSSTATPPAAPQKSFQQELDDLRKASAQATMAGPSKEAQALMSTRAKRLLGPDKLRAGIEGQERVQRMMSGTPEPTSTPKPTAPTSTTTSSPTSKLEIKPGDFGTTMGPGPTFRGGPVPPKLPNRNAIRPTDWTKIPEEVNIYDQVLEILLDEGYSVQESNRIMVELVNENFWKAVQNRIGIGKPGVGPGQVAKNIIRAGITDILGTSIGAGSAPSVSAPANAPTATAQSPAPVIRTSTATIRTAPKGANKLVGDVWPGGQTGTGVKDILNKVTGKTQPTTTRALTGSSGPSIRGLLPQAPNPINQLTKPLRTVVNAVKNLKGGAITTAIKPGAVTSTVKKPDSLTTSARSATGMTNTSGSSSVTSGNRGSVSTSRGTRSMNAPKALDTKPGGPISPSGPTIDIKSNTVPGSRELKQLTSRGVRNFRGSVSAQPSSTLAPSANVDKLAPKLAKAAKPAVKPQMPGGGSAGGPLTGLKSGVAGAIITALAQPVIDKAGKEGGKALFRTVASLTGKTDQARNLKPTAYGKLGPDIPNAAIEKGVKLTKTKFDPIDPMPTPEILRRAGVSSKPSAKPADTKPVVKPAAKPVVKPAAKPVVKPAAKPVDPELQKYEKLRKSDPVKAKELGTKIWLKKYGAPTEGDIA